MSAKDEEQERPAPHDDRATSAPADQPPPHERTDPNYGTSGRLGGDYGQMATTGAGGTLGPAGSRGAHRALGESDTAIESGALGRSGPGTVEGGPHPTADHYDMRSPAAAPELRPTGGGDSGTTAGGPADPVSDPALDEDLTREENFPVVADPGDEFQASEPDSSGVGSPGMGGMGLGRGTDLGGTPGLSGWETPPGSGDSSDEQDIRRS